MYIYTEITYDTVWAKAPASPPHKSLAGTMRTSFSGFFGFGLPQYCGKFSIQTLFNVSKPKNDKPVNDRMDILQMGHVTKSLVYQ